MALLHVLFYMPVNM